MPVQETSRRAWARLQPLLNRRQAQVLRAYRYSPGHCFSNMEITERLGWSINRVTGRVLELRELKCLVHCGTRPCNVTGNTVNVYKLNPELIE